jgi:osmotically-inducible protein OsmY
MDADIRRDVEDELRWDPDIDATDIAVAVRSGVVTLAGFVRSYMQKYQAEVDAKRVAGVVAVANDIEVRLPGVDERPDPDIARDAVERIKSELPFSWDKVRVILKSGWVTLEGETEWNYQRGRAETAITPRSRRERHHQSYRGKAPCRSHGDQTQDRGSVAAGC